MSDKKEENILVGLPGLLISLIAIVALKSIFDSDSSKIVSSRGRRLLGDKDKMKDLDNKFKESEKSEEQEDIYI